MSNDKEIKIRAVLSSEGFDAGVREIQEKLKKITQQQAQGSNSQQALGKDSVLGKYAQQAFGNFSKESQKQLESMYQTQRREAVNQSVTMKGKEAELAKMAKIDGEMTKQQKERTENLKKEIDLLKEKHRLTLNTAAETQKALDKMKPAGAGGGDAGGGGGQPPQDPASGFKNVLGSMIKSVGVAALIKGAISGTVQVIDDSITRDRKINMNNASALNSASREMREDFSGRGSRGMFYMPERQRAMSSAAQEQGSQGTMDKWKAWGGSALQGIGVGTMALTGWTGVGLGVGAGLAGAGSMLKGGVIGDEKSRAAMWDKEKFNSMQNKEGMEKYEANLIAQKAKDPRRAMAQEYFEQNRQDIVAMQRLTGTSDSEYLGTGANKGGGSSAHGILQTGMRAGGQFGGSNFNQQTIEQQMQALASGGAMTSGINELSGAAATYNRQFNQSSAGSTMGKMQGNTGMNSSLTDMAYQKLLTEAVRLGVDASKMPRELEKMVQMTAEITTSGGVNATGMGDLFNSANVGFNQKALGAAANSAEAYKSTSKASGDWEGQMGYSFMQSDKGKKILGGRTLGSEDMNYLNQTSASELDEKGFKRIAAGLGGGITPDQVKEYLTEKDKFKQSRSTKEDDAYKALGDFKKSGGDMNSEEGLALDYKARTIRSSTRGGSAQESQVQQDSMIALQSNVAAGVSPSMDLATASGKTAAQKGKKVNNAGELEEGAEATGDMTRLSALNEQLENLRKAAKNHTEYAEIYNAQFKLMSEATKKGADAMTAVAAQLSEASKKIEHDNATNGVYTTKPSE